jgi:two-component system, NarL family, sensor histidine kinase EvgS
MPATSPPLPFFRVLIVDDDPICSKILTRVIESQHPGEIATLRVTILGSAEEALRDLETACYDIIFTDIEMGQISGDDMTRTIRAGQTHLIHRSNRDIPIIAVTARVDPDSRARYEDAGITECVAKPVSKEIIKNIIRERIEQII